MYQAKTIVVKRKQKALYNYCKKACEDAKLLKNAVIFRCRQIIFADRKEYKDLHELERQVLEEIYISPAQEQQNFATFSSDLFDRVKDSFILTSVMGSDHCPVGIILE